MAIQKELPRVTKQIDGTTYVIQTLDALEARKIWTPLFRAIGGAFEAFNGSEASGGAVLARLFQGLDGALLDLMADTYAPRSFIQEGHAELRVSDVYSMHFGGRPAHHTKWLIACTEVNFRDFFDGSSGLNLRALMAAAASKSQSPTT